MESAIRSELGSFGAAAGQTSARSFSDRFGSGVRKLGSAVGGTIVSGVKTAGAVAGGLLATSIITGFKRFSTIEDALSSMTTQLGDAVAAGHLLDEILKVVQGTPFNFDQFAAAGQQLVGFGIKAGNIPGILTAVGEAAATQGSRAGEFADRLVDVFGQVAARGRVQLEDVWRISETGVNALAILANSFGVTTVEMQKLIRKGAVPADEAIAALTKGIVEGSTGAAGATVAFGGTMAGLRQTLTGSFGGFRTAMARFGAAIVGPFGPALTKVFASLSDTFDVLAGRVSGFLKRFVASPGFDKFVALIQTLPEKIGPLIDKLGGLGPLVAGLGGAFGIMGAKSLPVVGNLLSGVNPLLAGFAALVATSPELRGAFSDIVSALSPLISQLVKGLQPVIASLVPIIDKVVGALGPVLGAILAALLPVLPPLASVFAEIADSLADVLISIVPILPPLAQFAALLINTIGIPVLHAIAVTVGLIASAFAALPGPLQAVVGGFALGIGPIRKFDGVLTKAFGPIRSLSDVRALASLGIEKIGGAFSSIVGVVGKVGPLLGKVGGAFKAFGSLLLANPIFLIIAAVIVLGIVIFKFRKQILAVLKIVGGAFATAGKAIARFFKELPGRVLGFAKRFLPIILAVLFPPAAIALVLVKFWGPISRFFTSLPGRILNLLAAAGSWLLDVGKRILQGLWDGFRLEMQTIGRLFANLPGWVASFFKNAGRWLLGVGRDILRGLWEGIKLELLVLGRFFKNLPHWIANFFTNAGKWLLEAGRKLFRGWVNGAKLELAVIGRVFAAAFGVVERIAGGLVSTLVRAFRFIANVWLSVVGSIIHGAAVAFGWVPGIGGKLKAADKSFRAFKNSFLGTLDDMANKAKHWGERVVTKFVDGMSIHELDVAVEAGRISSILSKNMRTQSPAKEGPLSLGGGPEGWGRRFSKLYMTGIIEGFQREQQRLTTVLATLTAPLQEAGSAGFTIPVSVEHARTLAPSRSARPDRLAAARASVIQNINIVNAKPEPASASLPVALRRAKIKLRRS